MQIRIHSEVELIVISHNYVKTVIFFSKRFVDLHLLFLCIFTTIQTFCLQFYYTEHRAQWTKFKNLTWKINPFLPSTWWYDKMISLKLKTKVCVFWSLEPWWILTFFWYFCHFPDFQQKGQFSTSRTHDDYKIGLIFRMNTFRLVHCERSRVHIEQRLFWLWKL